MRFSMRLRLDFMHILRKTAGNRLAYIYSIASNHIAMRRIPHLFKPHLPLLFFYTLLIFLPTLRLRFFSYSTWIWQLLPFAFANAYLLCLLGNVAGRFLGKRAKMAWHLLCHAIVCFFAFLHIYLVKAFGAEIDETTILLLLQTNPGEANEFLHTHLLSPAFFKTLALVGTVVLAEFLTLKHFRAGSRLSSSVGVKVFVGGYLLLGCFGFVKLAEILCSNHAYQARKIATESTWNLGGNTYVNLYLGCRSTLENIETGRQVANHIHDTRIESRSNYTGEIVLVVGESHIKSHSSLYGYSLPTMPLLQGEGENLIAFDDVISPSNFTQLVLQSMLSVASLSDSLHWYEAPLFPAVFKAAGWDVVLSSNHFTDQAADDVWNAAIDAYLNVPEVSQACFTDRNRSTFTFDGEMVDSFLLCRRRAHTASEKPTLTILHLMGQHIGFDERYPVGESHFTMADYRQRTELTDAQKQAVAHYDNATRYLDLQLHKLIEAYRNKDALLIYLSDHGEEVYDYRNQIGRSQDLSAHAPQAYHAQIDIPFLVYMTDSYQAAHPDLAARIRAFASRPFMSDDLSHLLFHLAGIRTRWFDPAKSPLHDDYRVPKARILINGDNYDEQIKKRGN